MRAVLIYEGGPSCYLSEINHDMATTPIWQDTSYNIPHGELFRLSDSGGVFYRGRAVTPTGTGNAAIYINRICAPRMVYGVPNFNSRTKADICLPRSFTLQRSANGGGSWTNVATVSFRPDWSYRTNAAAVRNIRINDHFHPKMCLFFSVLEYSISTINGWYDIGNGHVNTSYSNMTGSKTASYPLTLVGDSRVKSAGIGSLTWATPRPCATHALYYRNAFGGWDPFLIEGNVVESLEPQRWTRKEDYNNAASFVRGEVDYVNECARRWTLNTGGLTDTESATMWHLIQSNDVWLHDFVKDTILPVILDDTSQAEKTYKNTGRRIVTYTINCHLALERIAQ